jgi:hypothetical protein
MWTNSPAAADVDAALARWRDLAAHAGEAIDALSHDPVYLRLKTQGRAGNLTGASRAAAEDVTAAVDRLWNWYLLLVEAIAKADELRRTKGLLGGEDRLERAAALLEGPSIQLPAPPSGAPSSGLAARDLTPATPATITPTNLLARMNDAFAMARDLVLAAERGWDGGLRLVPYGTRASALNDEAARLGCSAPSALAEIGRLIAEAEASVEADPIGAAGAGDHIAILLDKADAALAQPRADAANAQAILDAGSQTLAALADLFTDTQRGREARLAAIADLPDAPALADPSPDLAQWLTALVKALAEGQARAVRIGAGRWDAAAHNAEASLTAQRDADRRLLAAREDMRGRFAALSVKARARRTQGRLPPEAGALLTRAEGLLVGRPTPMAEAVQALRQLETALSRKDSLS